MWDLDQDGELVYCRLMSFSYRTCGTRPPNIHTVACVFVLVSRSSAPCGRTVSISLFGHFKGVRAALAELFGAVAACCVKYACWWVLLVIMLFCALLGTGPCEFVEWRSMEAGCSHCCRLLSALRGGTNPFQKGPVRVKKGYCVEGWKCGMVCISWQ